MVASFLDLGVSARRVEQEIGDYSLEFDLFVGWQTGENRPVERGQFQEQLRLRLIRFSSLYHPDTPMGEFFRMTYRIAARNAKRR
jgi:hypothetical protein